MPGGLSRPPGERADPVVGTVAGLHVVVADHADRAVRLEHGEQDVPDVGHAVLTERLQQLLAPDAGTLRPAARPDAGQVRKWIADLDADAFATREAASRQLARLGEDAEAELRAALASAPPPEVRRRVESLLTAALDAPPAGRRREVRGVWVLELADPVRWLRALAPEEPIEQVAGQAWRRDFARLTAAVARAPGRQPAAIGAVQASHPVAVEHLARPAG